MKDLKLIEYKVRPVTRFIVTRFEATEDDGGCATQGEFDNEKIAHAVGYALCKAEHDRLGWPPGDERIRYPSESVKSQDAVTCEIERLRSEYGCQKDPAKSSQLYAAMQALEWAKNPENAAAPTWVILAGKAQPLLTA